MKKIKKQRELEKSGAKLPKRVIERRIKREIIPWIRREEVIIITGARQTGKSVLLFQLIYDHLLPKTNNIYYFNLDIPHQLSFFDNPDRLINLVNKHPGKTYVFIDEVQRLKEPGLFLKGLYDLHLPLKLIVSGSSAIEIKSKIHESLTGRKVVFHLTPFNPEELGSALFPQKSFLQIIESRSSFKKVLAHYLTYGSYPAVSLAKTEKIKIQLLKEIFSSYLEKDVKDFLKVENENAFRNLVKILASQIGNLINKDELSNSLGIHKNTLDNYLFYLEQTYILDFVRPFFKNTRKEILKSPKVYFRDAGIRNFALMTFANFDFRPDKGRLFENIIYLCLKEKTEDTAPIHFWRTKAGAEVDFIVTKGLKPLPLEAKATAMTKVKISRSLRSFIQAYHPENAYCINLSLNKSQYIGKTQISFLDPVEFLKAKKV